MVKNYEFLDLRFKKLRLKEVKSQVVPPFLQLSYNPILR